MSAVPLSTYENTPSTNAEVSPASHSQTNGDAGECTCTALQRQKAVSAYFTSKQILPFALQYLKPLIHAMCFCTDYLNPPPHTMC